MSIVPLPFELDLSLDTLLEVERVYFAFTHGVFDRQTGLHVLGLLHLVRNWIDEADQDANTDNLMFMGIDILEMFPENPWLVKLKDTFERFFMLKTCLYGYGAPTA